MSLILVISIILLLALSNHNLKDREEPKDNQDYIIMESSNFAYKAYSSDDYIEDDDWDLVNSIAIEYEEVKN
ncbi:hypothetical protein BX659_10951 [Orenia metallireducens]|uniref:Uncharacterized protein n=1 Tax=Orenia metallireducens TaxID=1413210 RepID=A0A285H2B7_9FIRM|nr:hypothetical protein [Orenia metallireducens]PRX29467.1 hypothetical protein BX659_10951 [Orenia metallireducens]SNY30040.1 hypothetical protein SAMN06265827_11351 [Orenia metallireducens]